MPITHDISPDDGSRIIMIEQADGLKITLYRLPSGVITVKTHFQEAPVNPKSYSITKETEAEVAEGMGRLYGGST